MDVARGDEDVEVRPLGDPDRLDGPLRVAVAAAGERRDRDPALRLLGDPADGLEVAGRGGREAGLDDVDLEPGQLAGDLELLGGGQPGARRLLAVAQGRVEDADAAGGDRRAAHRALPAPRRPRRDPPEAAAPTAPWAWPASTTTGLRNGIWARRSRADLLDLVVAGPAARSRSNSAAAGLALGDPAARRTTPSWMSVRTSFIVVFGRPRDDPRARDVVAVLGGVADAEAHEVQAAAVHQVDDQLELVHRLEVGELGLVAGLDERLERHLDQGRDAAAQERLLAEQVGLGLLLERRLEDAGPGRADRRGRRRGRGRGRCRTRRARRRTGPARRRRPRRRERRRWPGPFGATIPTSTCPAASIRPNRMLKPWANIRSWPGRRFGSISAS